MLSVFCKIKRQTLISKYHLWALKPAGWNIASWREKKKKPQDLLHHTPSQFSEWLGRWTHPCVSQPAKIVTCGRRQSQPIATIPASVPHSYWRWPPVLDSMAWPQEQITQHMGQQCPIKQDWQYVTRKPGVDPSKHHKIEDLTHSSHHAAIYWPLKKKKMIKATFSCTLKINLYDPNLN